MDNKHLSFETDLIDLDTNNWLAEIDDICDEHGFFEQLGAQHFAGFLEAGNKLLVTFENIDAVQKHNADAAPRGFGYAQGEGWSHLGLLSRGQTWFRDDAVYDFFDGLVDEGFFEAFDTIVFYGANDGGYAAAAFAVAAPGATVIALRPQATLKASVAGWDPRYKQHRRYDFSSRYGYAPDMVEGSKQVFVLYDPVQRLDAGHAALFRKPHVTLLACPFLGSDLDQAFDRMGIHEPMLKLAMDRTLDQTRFAQLLRARRYDQAYVRSLVNALVMQGHVRLAAILCDYMLQRGHNDFFRQTLQKLGTEPTR